MNRPKSPIWLPYLDNIKKITNNNLQFSYKGGSFESDLSDISSILIYGDFGSIDSEIIDLITRKGIPIILHRRNLQNTILIHSGIRADKTDTLTAQILARKSKIKSKHIAKKLLIAKFDSQSWLIDIPKYELKDKTIDLMRNIEAKYAKLYWDRYYQTLKIDGYRRDKNPLSFALDGASKFMYGILLRWINYHHLSPFHGYLHVTTEYPSLVYDLLEPYRGGIEQIVFNTFIQNKFTNDTPNDKAFSFTIESLKEYIKLKTYTGITRQIIHRQELYHGIVLSLKAYITGLCDRFVVPTESKPNGGRPIKVPYKFYGIYAGKSPYWKEAKSITSIIQK